MRENVDFIICLSSKLCLGVSFHLWWQFSSSSSSSVGVGLLWLHGEVAPQSQTLFGCPGLPSPSLDLNRKQQKETFSVVKAEGLSAQREWGCHCRDVLVCVFLPSMSSTPFASFLPLFFFCLAAAASPAHMESNQELQQRHKRHKEIKHFYFLNLDSPAVSWLHVSVWTERKRRSQTNTHYNIISLDKHADSPRHGGKCPLPSLNKKRNTNQFEYFNSWNIDFTQD